MQQNIRYTDPDYEDEDLGITSDMTLEERFQRMEAVPHILRPHELENIHGDTTAEKTRHYVQEEYGADPRVTGEIFLFSESEAGIFFGVERHPPTWTGFPGQDLGMRIAYIQEKLSMTFAKTRNYMKKIEEKITFKNAAIAGAVFSLAADAVIIPYVFATHPEARAEFMQAPVENASSIALHSVAMAGIYAMTFCMYPAMIRVYKGIDLIFDKIERKVESYFSANVE